jgi:hypothetical protein
MVLDGMRLQDKIRYCRNKIRSEFKLSTRAYTAAGKTDRLRACQLSTAVQSA